MESFSLKFRGIPSRPGIPTDLCEIISAIVLHKFKTVFKVKLSEFLRYNSRAGGLQNTQIIHAADREIQKFVAENEDYSTKEISRYFGVDIVFVTKHGKKRKVGEETSDVRVSFEDQCVGGPNCVYIMRHNKTYVIFFVEINIRCNITMFAIYF